MKLTPEQVRELLDYDPETGILTWRKRPLRPGFERIDKGWNARFVGKEAGTKDHHGHTIVVITDRNGKPSHFAAHRLGWAHFYGEWPSDGLDHINGSPSDNRMANLRIANQQQNAANMKVPKNNTSGAKGVSFNKKSGKWMAYLKYGGKRMIFGYFHTKELAILVRQIGAACHFGEFSNEKVQVGS